MLGIEGIWRKDTQGRRPGSRRDGYRSPPDEAEEPGPPLPVLLNDQEKYSYVRSRAWLLNIGAAASFPVLLFTQIRLMLQYHWFWLGHSWGSARYSWRCHFTDALTRGFELREHRRLVDSWRPGHCPSVAVFLPVCSELETVLRNTWEYVAQLRDHYKGVVTPYALDDSANPPLKALAREFGFAYATRPNRGWFKKPGNLSFGCQVSYGEYVLLLDADFAPRHDLLDEVLPTWRPSRGPGSCRPRRSSGSPTSRPGWSAGDNLGTTLARALRGRAHRFRSHRLGWKLHYLPIALSTGNCPDNVLAFLNQPYRWCSGAVGSCSGRYFGKRSFPRTRGRATCPGFVYYIYTALFIFVAPALTVAILAFVPNVLQLKNMIFIVPVLRVRRPHHPRPAPCAHRLEAWAVKVISGWAHFFAYWDALRGKRLGRNLAPQPGWGRWSAGGGDRRGTRSRRLAAGGGRHGGCGRHGHADGR